VKKRRLKERCLGVIRWAWFSQAQLNSQQQAQTNKHQRANKRNQRNNRRSQHSNSRSLRMQTGSNGTLMETAESPVPKHERRGLPLYTEDTQHIRA